MEGFFMLGRIEEIDQKIIQVQKSTKTLFSFFAPWHHYCRSKCKPYYFWHLNPFSKPVHWAFLILYCLSLFLIIVSLSIAPPAPPTQAAIYTNTSADVVVGQPDFTTGTAGTTQRHFK